MSFVSGDHNFLMYIVICLCHKVLLVQAEESLQGGLVGLAHPPNCEIILLLSGKNGCCKAGFSYKMENIYNFEMAKSDFWREKVTAPSELERVVMPLIEGFHKITPS